MKTKLLTILILMSLTLAGCGVKQAEVPEGQVDNAYVGGGVEQSAELTPETDEAAIAENRLVAGAMLDCFMALDYDGALVYMRENDREMFNVESAQDSIVYSMLLSRMSYELGESFTDQFGNRYVRAEISAPSMIDVYGEVLLMMNDVIMSGEFESGEELQAFNDQSFVKVIENGEIGTSTITVDIGLENDTDGELRVIFTPEILNAMLGDIQNASQQINEALSEGIEEYTSARDAGAFD